MTNTMTTTAGGLERLFVQREGIDFPLRDVKLSQATDDELAAISETMGIGLSLDEMKDARAYFEKLGRDPTDVEMEALGQAWSEHCCYKSSKPILAANIYGIHEDKLAVREDAGLVPFTEDTYYAVKLESHNHPSALEPYGGSATGVGGVIRDVLCMGAQPIALIDPLFFGPLDMKQSEVPPGTKHPRYLMQGVVAGIRDYGNRVGIPTVAGGVTFHPGYTTNCLVNVGCIGIMPRKDLQHSFVKNVGDVYIYVGGRTGRDGIHGVTFASAELEDDAEEEDRGAVQLGDPVTKEPVIHATLEITRKGLLQGMKDFGGGGLSCVTGELAYDAGFGCEVQLDDIPLKEPGLAPWEMWVSESQERMMWVVKPEDVDEALHIAKKWDVEAVVCGKVVEDKTIKVTYKGTTVLEYDLEFSTGGPVYDRPIQPPAAPSNPVTFEPIADNDGMLDALLRNPNIASKEWVIRQYDHIVRGNTAIWPMQGVYGKEGPGDATVIKPVPESWKGLALTSDINPRYTERDPYNGTMAGIDETVRNLAAVGARLSTLADCLNFGNPQKPERMGDLQAATQALGDSARKLGVPFSSGNVSLYNESSHAAVPPTPSLLGIGIVEDIRHCVTTDLKQEGNHLLLIGDTVRAFGGSAVTEALGIDGDDVPKVDLDKLQTSAEALVTAIESDLVRSCHDVSEGGLAVALTEMAIGGDIGIQVDLAPVGHTDVDASTTPDAAGADMRFDEKLYTESPTRWIIECTPENVAKVEAHFRDQGITIVPLGTIGGRTIDIHDTAAGIDAGTAAAVKTDVDKARHTWAHAIGERLGEMDEAPAAITATKGGA